MRCVVWWVGRWFCVKSDVVGMLVGGSLAGNWPQAGGNRGMVSDAGAAAIAAALPNSKLAFLK